MNSRAFLTETAANLRRMTVKLNRVDGSLVERDIAARRLEADIGHAFALKTDRIAASLEATGSNQSIGQWCKEHCNCDVQTMRRRKRLAKQWKEYETRRRELGSCGQSGLLFGLSLVSPIPNSYRNKQSYATVRSVAKTISRPAIKSATVRNDVDLITGDALTVLPTLKEKSVHCITTSPPYWPTKRAYGGKGIGFEKTLAEYIADLVAVLRQAKRVLRDDGILWVVIDDAYARPCGHWHHDPKSPALRGLAHQGGTDVRDRGNLLLIPARFALAMQDDGWIFRSEIIWAKTNFRPESVTDRPTKDFEKVLMFVKQRRYFYNSDPIRIPLKDSKGYTIPGRNKPGMNRADFNRTERVYSNPLGRNSGSVWTIAPSGYRGDHAATMPEERVRRCLSVSCPDENALVLDPFGGAATVALVARSLGHRAISIDIAEKYTKEARERLEAA